MAASTRSRKKAGDFTGRQAENLAAEAAQEKTERAKEMAMMTAEAEREVEETVQDMTVQPSAPTIVDEVVEVGVVLADDSIVVRMAETVENMTFGHGNHYHLEAGRKYKLPRAVAERLQSLGLLYERY